jgi:cytochrome c1
MTRSLILKRILPLAAVVGLASCGQPDRPHWPIVGDAAQGKVWAGRMGCGSCHYIPGLENANGLVGPPLTHFAQRTMVAGVLANTPPNLVQWIKEPQVVVPGNAMPTQGLTESQARDIAAYLYTLD